MADPSPKYDGVDTQLTLPHAHARRTDPETSQQAAVSVRVLKQRSYVLAAARLLGVFTDPMLQFRVREMYSDKKFSDSGVRTRRSELVTLRLIKDSGRRVTLDTGRHAILWEVCR